MTRDLRAQRPMANPARGAYERSDMDGKAAGLTIAALAGLVALVALGVAGLFLLFGSIRQPKAPAPRLAAPAPMLQVNEPSDRALLEARTQARLDGRDGGFPISEAMGQTAALGWDAPR